MCIRTIKYLLLILQRNKNIKLTDHQKYFGIENTFVVFQIRT